MWCRTRGWRVWKCDRKVAGGEKEGLNGRLRDGAWTGGAGAPAKGNEGLPGAAEISDAEMEGMGRVD